MTEEISIQSYCEVCGITVDANTSLKRFDMLFCSELHMNQYVTARQKKIGISEQDNRNRLEEGGYETEKQEEQDEQPKRRKRSWFRESCC